MQKAVVKWLGYGFVTGAKCLQDSNRSSLVSLPPKQCTSHPYPQLSSFLKTLAESDIVVLPGPPESGTECGWCSCQEVAQWILTLVEVLAWEEASVLWSWTHKDCERQM